MNSFSVDEFIQKRYPHSNPDTIQRRNRFGDYFKKILPSITVIEDLQTYTDFNYSFFEVRGDGNCCLHSILRYYGTICWLDLPDKDYGNLNSEESAHYTGVLETWKNLATQYIRDFMGDSSFELDSNCPEYQLICKCISDYTDMRIIVVEYSGTNSGIENKVYEFVPESGTYSDTVILLNMTNHFTLIFPRSSNSYIDPKMTRKLVGDLMLTNAFLNDVKA